MDMNVHCVPVKETPAPPTEEYNWKDLINGLVHDDYSEALRPALHKTTQTQTVPTTEFLLGKLVLQHCPEPALVINYVKHANISAELLQSLTLDKTLGQVSRNAQSRSNE